MKRLGLFIAITGAISLHAQIPAGTGSGGGSGSGSSSPPIAVPFTAVTTITSLAADTGRSTSDIAGECFDNATPANTIVQTAGFPTKSAAGAIIWAWTGSKTGTCYVITGGASNTAGGDLTGTYPNPSYTTVPIAKGGTGQTTAATARTALGLAIGTNVEAWSANLDALSLLTVSGNGTALRTTTGAFATNDCVKVDSNGNLATAGAACGAGGGGVWGSITGTLTAQTDLTTYLSTNYQGIDTLLTALAALPGNGILAQTAAGTAANRTITGTANKITMTNGDGVSGNPTITIADALDLSANTSTKPLKTGTTAPLTCTVGMFFYDTDDVLLKVCSVVDTWTDITGGGGGITAAALAAVIVPGADICITPTINGSDLELPFDTNCLKSLAWDWSGLHTFDLGYVDVQEVAAPANPASGYLRVYADTADSTLKCKDSSGASCLAAGSASGATKYTVAFGALDAAGTSDETLVTLSGTQVIRGCHIKQSTAFTGGSLSAVTVSVGISGVNDLLCPVLDVFATASNTLHKENPVLWRSEGSQAFIAHFICTGANCNAATAGSLDVYLWIETLP